MHTLYLIAFLFLFWLFLSKGQLWKTIVGIIGWGVAYFLLSRFPELLITPLIIYKQTFSWAEILSALGISILIYYSKD